jgi:uncharacterized membrane protein YeaQ/YmgE (transglycosylase-associated protein family)
MNIAIWILAGGAVGWGAYALLHANQRRGLMASIIIGVTGGLLGGEVIAPMFGAMTETSNALNPFALVVALAGAAACLTVGNMLSDRFGI